MQPSAYYLRGPFGPLLLGLIPCLGANDLKATLMKSRPPLPVAKASFSHLTKDGLSLLLSSHRRTNSVAVFSVKAVAGCVVPCIGTGQSASTLSRWHEMPQNS